MTTTYRNPYTESRYRLIAGESADWRITKSVTRRTGSVSLYHLHGVRPSAGAPPQGLPAAIDRLLRGTITRDDVVIDDPDRAFVSTTLTDMDRTFDLVCSEIKSAMYRYDYGSPGFRPRSTPLRQEKDRLVEAALSCTREFARWWQASGFQTDHPPLWLTEALEAVAREPAQMGSKTLPGYP